MSSEAKKTGPVQQHGSENHAKHADVPSSKGGKQPGSMPGGCQAWGCKKEGQQFSFCHEHYDHFKFGLIKKTGEPVPDYEKKFEHYMAWKARQKSAHKVA